MKKIFYKIFIYFCMAAYLPLLLIYVFNYFYVDKYIVEDKRKALIHVAESVDLERLKVIKREDRKYKDSKVDVYIRYIDLDEKNSDADFFRLINKSEMKLDIKNMALNEYDIKTVKLSSLTNHFFLIKKISDHEILSIIGEMVVPDVVTAIMIGIYKQYSMFIIPLLLLGSYVISKKFSEPIEKLEKISTQISNADFTDKVEINSKNELESLGNNINKMAGQLQDNIKELNTLNEQLKKELKEKENLLETEKTFMRAIGHELKTPVAIINGYIEALQDDMIEAGEIKKTYDIIYNEGMSISKMVKDINDYLKFEFKRGEPFLENVNVKKMLESSLDKYTLDLEQREIRLTKNLKNVEIKTDIKFLGIVINNLLTNAITYVDDRKEIEIELNESGLRIVNSSDYISEEALSKIFNPFYKIDKSRNRKYGGTGLGLSIVKNLLEFLNFEYAFNYDKDRKYAIFDIKFF